MVRMLYALGVCGSPRRGGNTEILLRMCLDELKRYEVKVELLRLADLEIKPCTGCRACLRTGRCCLEDDMTERVIPRLLEADIIVLASPVFFNNVSAQMKAFMDRTWCLRGRLKDKVGGGIVVGRRYGLEQALAAIHAFMLKHDMVLCCRGVSARAFEAGEVLEDEQALADVKKLARRLYEVASRIRGEKTA